MSGPRAPSYFLGSAFAEANPSPTAAGASCRKPVLRRDAEHHWRLASCVCSPVSAVSLTRVPTRGTSQPSPLNSQLLCDTAAYMPMAS